MTSTPTSRWPLLAMVLALAVIGVVYFIGLQQPLTALHDVQLPLNPTPVAVPPDEQAARPTATLITNPIDQTVAGRGAAITSTDNPSPEASSDTPAAPSVPFAAALEALVGTAAYSELLLSDDFINRVVVTVDNLSHNKLPARFWPLRPLASAPLVNGEGDTLTLAADNSTRYAAYVALLQRLDLNSLAALYGRDYQRFQQAYRELGYPAGYFNDRLVDVIDHLLVTPDANAPLSLVQPAVIYKFADAGLEARSLGQKLLLRLGPANAGIVKARLRELRRLVTRATP